MAITGPFYDASGAPYYYNTATQQRISAGSPGMNLGASPLLGAPAVQATNIPFNVASQISGATPQVAGQGGDLAALAAAFNSSGALTQQQINNQKAQFDANLEFQRQQMEQIGLPQLVIQQRLADLQQQQFQYQMYLTQQQQGLAESGLGLQALQAQAQLGGPSNWVQAYNLAQGLKQTDIPVFEQRLLTGQQTPGAVGGAGLSTPQSLFTLAQQAGAGGVPGVTINGQPVGGSMSIGGAINSSLAPMPFLSQGGGGFGVAGFAGAGGPLNRFGTTGAGPGSTTTAVAPGQSGPTTPENRSFGIGAASQDFGNGPGQGGIDVSGQRGLSTPVTTGFNTGDALRFNFAALTGKAPGSFIQLQDKNTGRVVGQSQVQGTNMPVTMTLLEDMNPSHTYHIFTDYPSEGGATAGIDFSPSQLAVDNSAQGQAARQAVVDFWHSPAGNVDNRAYAGNDIFDRAFTSAPALTAQSAAPAPAAAAPTAAPAAAPTTAPAPTPAGPDMSGVYGLGRAIFAAGGGALGPQSLEGLGPTGTSMLQSVGNAVGADWNTFANQYLRSRIGQGAAQAA